MIAVDKLRLGLARGVYTLTLRAFDISGSGVAVGYTLEIEDTGDIIVPLGTLPAAAGESAGTITRGAVSAADAAVPPLLTGAPTVPTSGQAYKTYTLRNEAGIAVPASLTDYARLYMVRKISGPGRFGLMGSEFTPLAQGSYFFEEGRYGSDGSFVSSETGIYDFMVDDDYKISFEIPDGFPDYSKKGVAVSLPAVWAGARIECSRYAGIVIEAKVEITIEAPDGKRLSASLITLITDPLDPSFGGYRFTPAEDGKYKITYTALSGSYPAIGQSLVLTVGDITPPTFTVSAPKAYALYDVFVFGVMSVAANSDDVRPGGASENRFDDIQFTKRLILPTGEIYSVSDWGNVGRVKVLDSKYADDGGYFLTVTGVYTVEYIAHDRVRNESKMIYEFSIMSATSQLIP